VTLRYYDGGHTGYSVAATAQALGNDIRMLISRTARFKPGRRHDEPRPACTCLGRSPFAARAADENLVIVSNGETVGSLKIHTQGNRVAVDYRVDDNGRGPKHHEDLVLDPSGVPTSWTIQGTSLMGGAVDESYAYASQMARWKSQADAGSQASARPPLYIANDDSPYALALYARAAMARPDHCLAVLPSGRVCAQAVRKFALGSGKSALPVTAWRITGVQLNPGYVLLDHAGRLAGVFGPGAEGTTVRAGYEADVPSGQAGDRAGNGPRAGAATTTGAPLCHAAAHPQCPRVRSGQRHPLRPVGRGGDARHDHPGLARRPRRARSGRRDGDRWPGRHGLSGAARHAFACHAAFGPALSGRRGHRHARHGQRQRVPARPDHPRRCRAGGLATHRAQRLHRRAQPYSARFGFIPASVDEALKDVRWYATRGYAEIKIYNSMNPDWVAPIAAEAHRLGLKVTGHVPAFDTPDRVIADGYDPLPISTS
jgi:hypothetical protein